MHNSRKTQHQLHTCDRKRNVFVFLSFVHLACSYHKSICYRWNLVCLPCQNVSGVCFQLPIDAEYFARCTFCQNFVQFSLEIRDPIIALDIHGSCCAFFPFLLINFRRLLFFRAGFVFVSSFFFFLTFLATESNWKRRNVNIILRKNGVCMPSES